MTWWQGALIIAGVLGVFAVIVWWGWHSGGNGDD